MLPLELVIGGVAAAFVGAMWWIKQRGANSDLEEKEEADKSEADKSASVLMDAVGWPYFWGKGTPATPWSEGHEGVDCSGFAQMAMVRLGILSPATPDRGAATMADDFAPVAVGSQRVGDLAYYPGHVMVVVSAPGSDGHSAVMGASGGTATTLGDDPHAYVKVFDTAEYRHDFVTYMRPKSEAVA